MRLMTKVVSILCLVFTIFLLEVSQNIGLAQSNWYKYAHNPVLEKGEPGSWDDENLLGISVIYDGETYHMWYHGNDAFGYATSSDGITWEKYPDNPVLETGGPGSWDELKLQMGHVIFEDNMYKMWYDGNGSFGWAIGLATSPDGIHWTKDSLNNPVLTTGESGSWDDFAVWSPHLIMEEGIYKMWYTGHQDRTDIGYYFIRIGYAESVDGINWKKNPEPVLEVGDYVTWGFDLMTPSVMLKDQNYHMWYGSIDTDADCCVQIDYALSPDGIEWEISPNNPALKPGSASRNYSLDYPFVVETDNHYKMWFNGNGEIGYAEDFSNLIHADSVIVEQTYASHSGKPVSVLGRIKNSQSHNLSAKALFLSDDGTVSDSITLLDNGIDDDGEAGNGIYGNLWTVSAEKNYNVAITTEDLETGFLRNGFDWSITDRFTSKGPVVVDSLLFFNPEADTEPNPGDLIRYDLKLLNEGETDTVYNVSINVVHISGYTQKYGFGSPVFGDLAPGESKKGNRYYGIAFSDSCPAPANIPFLAQIVSESDTFWTDTFYVFVDTILVDAIEEEGIVTPVAFKLNQNYPNPFNPKTIINYELQITNYVELSIYNFLGQKVATLVSEKQKVGNHYVEWDAAGFASGVYFYKLISGDFHDVKKMMLIK